LFVHHADEELLDGTGAESLDDVLHRSRGDAAPREFHAIGRHAGSRGRNATGAALAPGSTMSGDALAVRVAD
jgi:hypothetical protein